MFPKEKFLPKLVWLLSKWLSSSLRLKRVGFEPVEHLIRKEERILFVLWHGRHYLIYHYFPPQKTSILVSPSRDGRRVAALLQKSGFGIIHGSSHRSPTRALSQCVRWLQSGHRLILAVDGPTGPAGIVKSGAIYLAKKTHAWIVPLTFSTRKGIRLHSWDRFLIPFPFSQTILYFGSPYQPDPDLHEIAIEDARRDLESRLHQMTHRVDHIWN